MRAVYMSLLVGLLFTINGCLSNEGCDLELHQNWSCAHGGKGTVINPAVK